MKRNLKIIGLVLTLVLLCKWGISGIGAIWRMDSGGLDGFSSVSAEEGTWWGLSPFSANTIEASSYAAEESEEAAPEATPVLTQTPPAVLWGRDQLTAQEQAIYDRVCAAVAARSEEPVSVDAASEVLALVLEAVRMDHPEYFWFNGGATFVTTQQNGQVSTACTLTYTMELEEIYRANLAVETYTADCLATVAGAQTDYEKILGVYRYLILNTDYVLSQGDQSILTLMEEHVAVCTGYARSFQYLMHQLGIPCTLAVGDTVDDPYSGGDAGHAWNMVMCAGAWYQIDVTWGDPVNTDGTPGQSLDYTYCLLTDEEMYRDHYLTAPIPMPLCTESAYNYFVMEGLRMETWDPDAYQWLMGMAAQGGEPWFTVRLASREAYDGAVYDLFTQGRIFDVLEASGVLLSGQTVVYSQDELFYEISVQLS